MNKLKLREACKLAGIKNASRMTNGEMISALVTAGVTEVAGELISVPAGTKGEHHPQSPFQTSKLVHPSELPKSIAVSQIVESTNAQGDLIALDKSELRAMVFRLNTPGRRHAQRRVPSAQRTQGRRERYLARHPE